MRMLTYADRESLLEALEKLSGDETAADAELMLRASEAVGRVRSRFGFVDILSREVAALCAFLRQGLDAAAQRRVRGLLAFVAGNPAHEGTNVGDLGSVQAGAFLAGLVAHEIRNASGQPSTYRPYRLSRDDRQLAEDLLLAFAEAPLLPDQALLGAVARFREFHCGLRGAGIFGRLLRNLDILTDVLHAPGAVEEHRSWSRAALSYVVEERDAIHDSLGLAGLLDDAFIVNTVVDILNPEIAPWLDLLDAAVEAWPFANHLMFHDDESGVPASEFLIVNAALVCPTLRGNGSAKRTALILPSVGPIPLVVALMASLGALQEWLLGEDSPMALEKGQTVSVDNDGYAHFDGFESWDGQRGMILRYWNRKGRERRQWLPVEHLQRLTPAPSRLRPQGPVPRRWEQGIGRLSALEYLFHLDHPRPVTSIGKRVVLVTRAGRAHCLAASMRLCGLTIQDCFPMGHTTLVDGPPSIWSARFPSFTDPVLLVVPDLDDAAQIVADDPGRARLVILDLRGANAGRLAGLGKVLGQSPPVLAIADEGEQRAIEVLHERGFDFWEWSQQELQQLAWPTLQQATSPLARYERRLRWLTSVEPVVEEVEAPGLSEAFQALQRLQHLVRSREADVPHELQQALSSGWTAFYGLLRLANRDALGDRAAFLLGRLEQLEAGSSSIWLLDEESKAAQDLCQACRHALEAMDRGSPRARRLQALLQQQPEMSLIIRNERERDEIVSSFGLAPQRVLTPHEITDDGLDSGAVIVGWLGRHWMLPLLCPPVADPLSLLLYPVERRWYRSLLGSQQQAHRRRWCATQKQTIFPTVSWKPAREPRAAEVDASASPDPAGDLEVIDWYEVLRRHEIALRGSPTGTDPGPQCEAYLALFTDERFAFLTPQRRFAVVTSLLDGGIIATAPEVEERTITDLRSGDVLLLPTGADRDVIRSAANRLLSSSDREQATRWQQVLRSYVSDHGLTVEEIRDRLAASGCRRHPQTVGQWLRSEDLIAPQNAYAGDLEAIAAVTGDPGLAANLEMCKAAIAKVRHAHLTARRRLAEAILKQLTAEALVPGGRLPTLQVEGDLVLVRVELVDDNPTRVARSVANRLLEL